MARRPGAECPEREIDIERPAMMIARIFPCALLALLAATPAGFEGGP
jgi:hypothetical protein